MTHETTVITMHTACMLAQLPKMGRSDSMMITCILRSNAYAISITRFLRGRCKLQRMARSNTGGVRPCQSARRDTRVIQWQVAFVSRS